ncbi:hypothetical protein D9M68_443990 [compost metagenome]
MAGQPAAAFHVDLVVAIDHDLGNVVRRQQGLQRPQADRFVQHLAAQRRPVRVRRKIRIGRDDMGQQAFGLGAQHAVAHACHVAPAQIQRVKQGGMQAPALLLLMLRHPGRHRRGRKIRNHIRLYTSDGRAVGGWARLLGNGLFLLRQRDAQFAWPDQDFIAGQHGSMAHHPDAVDHRARQRAEVFQNDASVFAEQTGMLPPHPPVRDAQSALRGPPYQ